MASSAFKSPFSIVPKRVWLVKKESGSRAGRLVAFGGISFSLPQIKEDLDIFKELGIVKVSYLLWLHGCICRAVGLKEIRPTGFMFWLWVIGLIVQSAPPT